MQAKGSVHQAAHLKLKQVSISVVFGNPTQTHEAYVASLQKWNIAHIQSAWTTTVVRDSWWCVRVLHNTLA